MAVIIHKAINLSEQILETINFNFIHYFFLDDLYYNRIHKAGVLEFIEEIDEELGPFAKVVVGGAWKDVIEGYVIVGGQWKVLTFPKILVNTEWKEVATF